MRPVGKPIYSILEDEVELHEAVSDFVLALAERVDRLQDLHSTADFGQLAEQCGEIGDDAEQLGYPLLASLSRAAASVCRESNAPASEEALIELTALAQRIRQAHRGAA